MKRFIIIFYHSTACWGLFILISITFMFLAPALWIIFKIGGLYDTKKALQKIIYKTHKWYVGMLTQIVTPLRFVFIPSSPQIINDGPVLFVSNHSSVVDLLLLMSSLGPCSIIVKRSIGLIPLFGFMLKLSGAIFVDRKKKFEAAEIFSEMQKRFKNKECILTFPQGSRTLPWNRKTVKRGLFKLAMSEKVPIIPIAICGTQYILKKGQFFFDVTKPLTVKVHFLSPIFPEGNPENIDEVTNLRDKIVMQIESILKSEKDLIRENQLD